MQSKRNSRRESLVNVVVGMVTSFLLQLTLFPALGIEVTTQKNVIILIVFFIISYIRGYVIRRVFNKIR